MPFIASNTSVQQKIRKEKIGGCHARQDNLDLCRGSVTVRIPHNHGVASRLRPIAAVRGQVALPAGGGREAETFEINVVNTDLEVVDRIETRGS